MISLTATPFENSLLTWHLIIPSRHYFPLRCCEVFYPSPPFTFAIFHRLCIIDSLELCKVEIWHPTYTKIMYLNYHLNFRVHKKIVWKITFKKHGRGGGGGGGRWGGGGRTDPPAKCISDEQFRKLDQKVRKLLVNMSDGEFSKNPGITSKF